MSQYKQWLTSELALGIVGILAGCATGGNTLSSKVNNSGTISKLQSAQNLTNNGTPQQTSNRTNTGNTTGNQSSGQKSGTKSATAGYYKGLKSVTY